MVLKTISVCLLFFYACAQGELLKKPQTKEMQNCLNQFEEALNIAAKNHVTKPSYQDLVNSAISGMLKSLDPYSCYMLGDEVDAFLEDLSGSFGGIGIEIHFEEDGSIKVIAPIEDLPAAKVGVQSGDKIISIDGVKTKDLGFIKSLKKLRGKSGTKVSITITRPTIKAPLIYEITRVTIKTNPIKSQLDGDVAYIKMSRFSSKSSMELEQALDCLVKGKKNVVGVILDLRNNPGGSLNQAVAVSDYFLESGEVVGIKSREDNLQMIKVNQYARKAPNLPMVVLINQGSASASEIVAGALQDNKRALIMGVKSFGKGTVQHLIKTMKNDAMIKITTSTYCSPKGKFIDKKGIIPDVVVEQTLNPNKETSTQIKKSKEVLIQEDDTQYKKARALVTSPEYFEILKKSGLNTQSIKTNTSSH
jgi:carboxyl-terminal processing protease